MTVSAILALKGRDTYLSPPTATLAEVCTLLADRRIGAVMIADDSERLIGIVSERDIIRAVADDGAPALNLSVSDYMTTSVVTCSEDCTVDQVMQKMTMGNFRHIPVVRGGAIVGMISNRDLVRYRLDQVEREADEMRAYIATA